MLLLVDHVCRQGAKPLKLITIENDVAEIGPDRLVHFGTLKFSEGSEQKRVRLAFDMQVATANGQTFAVRSDFSEPTIILTHQTQWEASEGALFRYDAFRGLDGHPQPQITWPRFANSLQRHFLRVTLGSRPLSHEDLRYLHSRLGEAGGSQ